MNSTQLPPTERLPVIGILAGMGPHSTAPFIELLVAECRRQYGARDDIDFPTIVICSQPTPFYEDRPTDHAAMEAAVRAGLQRLERSGADFLAIACNTAHIYYDALAASVTKPLLDMVGITIGQLPRGGGRVALVAARPTAESQIYQQRIRAHGAEVVEIDGQDDVDALLSATRSGGAPERFRAGWRALTAKAEAAGADSLVVACLDLSATLPFAETRLGLIDASQCLAREVIREWLARRR
jgi:aspartate racemase